MRSSRFGWLVVIAATALSASACGDTEDKKKSPAHPQADSGGTRAGDGGTGGRAPSAGNGAGGNQARGGSEPSAGSSAGALSDGGANADAGATFDGGADAGGAGGESPVGDGCVAPNALSILGDYIEPNGDELWLRDSGKAVTLTRVTPGKPSPTKLPALWQAVRICESESALVLKNVEGAYTRLDFIKGTSSLTVCLAMGTAATPEAAVGLAGADRANTIDSGCNGGPWSRAVKGGN